MLPVAPVTDETPTFDVPPPGMFAELGRSGSYRGGGPPPPAAVHPCWGPGTQTAVGELTQGG